MVGMARNAYAYPTKVFGFVGKGLKTMNLNKTIKK